MTAAVIAFAYVAVFSVAEWEVRGPFPTQAACIKDRDATASVPATWENIAISGRVARGVSACYQAYPPSEGHVVPVRGHYPKAEPPAPAPAVPVSRLQDRAFPPRDGWLVYSTVACNVASCRVFLGRCVGPVLYRSAA
jgi:hypothetical protein